LTIGSDFYLVLVLGLVALLSKSRAHGPGSVARPVHTSEWLVDLTGWKYSCNGKHDFLCIAACGPRYESYIELVPNFDKFPLAEGGFRDLSFGMVESLYPCSKFIQ
jgi:hypothetical protein